MVPLKTLYLFSEPEAMSYIHSEEGHLEKSKQLVKALGLEGRVRELLVIGIDNLGTYKTHSEYPLRDIKLESERDIIKRPYYVSLPTLDHTLPLSDSNLPNQGFIGEWENKGQLEESIDYYITRSTNYTALAVVHPALVDFVSLLLEGKYDVKRVEIESNEKIAGPAR